MTFCMNVSRFMNLAAIFSLDLESQFTVPASRDQSPAVFTDTCLGAGLVQVPSLPWGVEKGGQNRSYPQTTRIS